MSRKEEKIDQSIKISNRGTFRQLAQEIANYLQQNYVRSEIWRHLTSQSKLNMSYSQFVRYVKEYIQIEETASGRQVTYRHDPASGRKEVSKDGIEHSASDASR